MSNSPQDRALFPVAGRRVRLGEWLAAFALAGGLYWLTMAPGVVWQDGGEIQLRVLMGQFADRTSLARTHILHFLLIWWLQKVPGLEAAEAANLVSVFVGGAITIANVYCLCTLLVGGRLSSICATGSLALAHTFWQFSTQAEVYTVTTALLSAEVLMLVLFARRSGLRWLVLAALFNGLGWSTHNVAMLTWPVYVYAAWWGRRRWPGGRAKVLAAVLAAWAAGLIPLLGICVAAYPQYGSLPALIRSLLVGLYGEHVFNVSVSPIVLAKSAGYLLLNFPSPLLLLVPVGWWVFPARRGWNGPLWNILTAVAIIHFLFAVRYTVPDQYSFFLPAYVLMTVFLGAGLEWVFAGGRGLLLRVGCAVMAFWSPVFYLLLPTVAGVVGRESLPLPTREIPYRDSLKWFLQPWRQNCDGPERYAAEALERAPRDAILLLDSTVRPVVLYVQMRDQKRLDVQVNKGEFQSWLSPEMVARETLDALVAEGRVQASATQAGYISSWIADRFRFTFASPLYHVHARRDQRASPRVPETQPGPKERPQ